MNLLNGDSSAVAELSFDAVVGDTLLASAVWVHGSELTGMDLYDSCIVTISIANKVFSIPAVRVLAAASQSVPDVEGGHLRQILPRGTQNWGPESVLWIYWIPCSDGRWLQANSERLKVTGKRKMEVLTDAELSERLRAGTLAISHEHVDHIKAVLGLSRSSSEILLKFLS
jgi:hypothetical protein